MAVTLHPLRRWLRRILLYAVIGLSVYLCLTVALAYAFLHPARLEVRRAPSDVGITAEDVHFRSQTDGLTLNGWWMAPKGNRPKGVIVLFHGYPGNRGDLVGHAAFLHRAGYAVLLFDFRALGTSEGVMSTIGYREVGDALAALDYARSRPDAQGLPIGVLGTSMGAAVALQVAARDPEVRAVVADSAYASLDRAIDQRFRGVLGASSVCLSLPVRLCGEQMMGTDSARVSPREAVAKLGNRPVFFLHGTADILIRPEDSRLLYEATTGPKQLWFIPGAGHVRGYRVAGKEYERRVVRFFDATLAKASQNR